MGLIDINDYNERLYTIKSLVHSLPEPNFNTLQYLMTHLGRVQDQYPTTKMDSANLAICFAPNLLRQQVDDLSSIIHTGKQSTIIDALIEQHEWVFDPYPEGDEDLSEVDDDVDGIGEGESSGSGDGENEQETIEVAAATAAAAEDQELEVSGCLLDRELQDPPFLHPSHHEGHSKENTIPFSLSSSILVGTYAGAALTRISVENLLSNPELKHA